VPRITNHLTFLLDGNLTSLCSCRMFQNLSLTQLAGDAPITSKQAVSCITPALSRTLHPAVGSRCDPHKTQHGRDSQLPLSNCPGAEYRALIPCSHIRPSSPPSTLLDSTILSAPRRLARVLTR